MLNVPFHCRYQFYGERFGFCRFACCPGKLAAGLAELNLTWQQAVVRLPVIAGDKRGYFLRDEVRDLLSSIGFSEIETVDRHEWYRELAKWELEQMSGPRREEFIRESGEENLQAAIIANQELVSVVNSGELRPTHVRARWLQ